MKYWIITTEYPPFHGGGISTYNYHATRMLAQKGHHVTVFVADYNLNFSSPHVTDEKENITVVRFKPADKHYYNFLGYHAALSFHFAEIVIEYIKENGKPDYIETQDYKGIGYYLLQKKRLDEECLANVPIVLTLHSPSYYYHDHCRDPLYKLPEYWVGEMEKWTMRAADILISPSSYLVENNKAEIGDRYEQYNIIPNPYVTDFKPVQTEKINEGEIIFFGKLTYQKGILELVQNMTGLWDDGFAYPLCIVGGDYFFELYQVDMKEYIIKKFQKYYKSGKIIFEGKLQPEVINKRLAKAHLIIIPSIVDNFPYAVVEAMAIGKVLLVSDGGGQKEIVEDGKSGFVYQRSNPASFHNLIREIFSLSPEKYKQISENAIKRIKELCSYDKVYERKMELLSRGSTISTIEYPFTRVISKKVAVIKNNSVANRLSIVVPYYNTGRYLRETVENILQINHPDKEVIIVNDGSDQEESLKALEKVEKDFPVKVVTQKNIGLPGARNTGAKSATGEFLAFLDADDMVDPNYHPRAIRLMKQYKNVSFVGCWAQYFDGDNGIWPTFTPEPPYLLIHNSVNSSSLIYRKAHFLTSGVNDMDMIPAYEDYQSVVHLVQDGFRGVVIPELLFKYRIHPSSLSRTFNTPIHLDAFRLLTKKHTEFFKEYSIDIINFLQANGPSHLYDNPTFEAQTDVRKLWDTIRVLEQEKAISQMSVSNFQTNGHSYSESLRNSDYNVILKENIYQRNQLQAIKDWYQKEYEVLPLWYKRFGHIIKIATGKRKINFKKK